MHRIPTCVSQTAPGTNSCSAANLLNQSTLKVCDRGQTVHVSKLRQGYSIISLTLVGLRQNNLSLDAAQINQVSIPHCLVRNTREKKKYSKH